MSFHKAAVASLVALSMTSAPALAAASSADRLSVVGSQSARAGVALEDESNMGGGFLIPLLALGAVVLGILVLLDDEDDLPTSP
jgi:hypothetical protein